MKRRTLTPQDTKHYRWKIQLDAPFDCSHLPGGFNYEDEIEALLEMIWSSRMTDALGIDLKQFRQITKVSILQQKRDLLDVAVTHGPVPTSHAFHSAMDTLLLAESTGHQPAEVRPPSRKMLPVRVEAIAGVEVWCGSAAAVRSDIALVLADLDFSYKRISHGRESSTRAHSLAGPRLRTDCRLLKSFYESEFWPGSVAITRGYFSGARFLVHAIPPFTANGIWKHSLRQLESCYDGFWEFANSVRADRIALQLICLGSEDRAVDLSCNILLSQLSRYRSGRRKESTIALVAHTADLSRKLAETIRLSAATDPRPAGAFVQPSA